MLNPVDFKTRDSWREHIQSMIRHLDLNFLLLKKPDMINTNWKICQFISSGGLKKNVSVFIRSVGDYKENLFNILGTCL